MKRKFNEGNFVLIWALSKSIAYCAPGGSGRRAPSWHSNKMSTKEEIWNHHGELCEFRAKTDILTEGIWMADEVPAVQVSGIIPPPQIRTPGNCHKIWGEKNSNQKKAERWDKNSAMRWAGVARAWFNSSLKGWHLSKAADFICVTLGYLWSPEQNRPGWSSVSEQPNLQLLKIQILLCLLHRAAQHIQTTAWGWSREILTQQNPKNEHDPTEAQSTSTGCRGCSDLFYLVLLMEEKKPSWDQTWQNAK